MKDSTRARVAAAVGAAALKKNVTSVYDYSASGHKNISASVSNGSLSGYDYSTSSHFSGGGSGSLDFYDYHNSKHVQLKQFCLSKHHSGQPPLLKINCITQPHQTYIV